MRFITTMGLAMALLPLTLTSVSAGVIIGGTRIIFDGTKKEASIGITNPDNVPYLIQSWIDVQDEQSGKAPFIITPPMYRLDSGQKNIERIVATGSLPQAKESLFWINIKAIPSASKQMNSLQIAVKTRIKLFWRPANIRLIPEDAAPKVKWRREGRNLIAENPNPIHISVMDVIVDGHDVPLNMIRPFETLTLPLPANSAGGQMTWRFINDYGAVSDPIKMTL